MASLLEILSDVRIWIPIFTITVFVIVRNIFFVRETLYIPGIEIIIVSFFLFFIAEKINEKTIECIDDLVYREPSHAGLDPNSPYENIAHNEHPKYISSNSSRPTHYAIVLVHGSCGGTQEMEKLARYFVGKGIDVYIPLLKYHKRTLEDLDKVDFNKMADDLQKDLEYVSKRHDKVFVVGHSLGGALIAFLSIVGRCPNNNYLILYAPALSSNVSFFMKKMSQLTKMINKYVFMPNRDLYSVSERSIINYIGARQFPIMIYDMNKMFEQMFSNNAKFHNRFAVLLFEKDEYIPHSIVYKLVSRDPNCVYCKVFRKFSHSPHFRSKNEDEWSIFLKILEQSMFQLVEIPLTESKI